MIIIAVWNVPLEHDTFSPVTGVVWLWSGHPLTWVSDPLIEVTLTFHLVLIKLLFAIVKTVFCYQ